MARSTGHVRRFRLYGALEKARLLAQRRQLRVVAGQLLDLRDQRAGCHQFVAQFGNQLDLERRLLLGIHDAGARAILRQRGGGGVFLRLGLGHLGGRKTDQVLAGVLVQLVDAGFGEFQQPAVHLIGIRGGIGSGGHGHDRRGRAGRYTDAIAIVEQQVFEARVPGHEAEAAEDIHMGVGEGAAQVQVAIEHPQRIAREDEGPHGLGRRIGRGKAGVTQQQPERRGRTRILGVHQEDRFRDVDVGGDEAEIENRYRRGQRDAHQEQSLSQQSPEPSCQLRELRRQRPRIHRTPTTRRSAIR